jgi:catechol 2,3-dioxygenase-like lactoylglutathione lyase family enzyme
MTIPIERLDHLVLTVNDLQATCVFYESVLGMKVVTFANGRYALQFGQQKINLHQAGKEFEPKAALPTLGSADLCFITSLPLDQIIAHIYTCNVGIVEGPVSRTGAMGPIESVSVRDPD